MATPIQPVSDERKVVVLMEYLVIFAVILIVVYKILTHESK